MEVFRIDEGRGFTLVGEVEDTYVEQDGKNVLNSADVEIRREGPRGGKYQIFYGHREDAADWGKRYTDLALAAEQLVAKKGTPREEAEG